MRKLPDPETVSLALAGLVWSKEVPSEEALQLKKTIVRFLLLSWTMCLSNISFKLKKKMGRVTDYIEKGLLTQEESVMLQVSLKMSRSCEQQLIHRQQM